MPSGKGLSLSAGVFILGSTQPGHIDSSSERWSRKSSSRPFLQRPVPATLSEGTASRKREAFHTRSQWMDRADLPQRGWEIQEGNANERAAGPRGFLRPQTQKGTNNVE